MKNKINESIILRALEWSYEKAISQSFPGIETAYELAAQFEKEEGPLLAKVDSLIRHQEAKAAAFGFATGVGGIVTLPIAVPVNLASVLFIQVRMIAAIAIMNGYDVKDERVKTMMFACLCGSAGSDILKNVGIEMGTKILSSILTKVSKDTINKVNAAVSLKILSRFTGIGTVQVGKIVPIFGALISGAFDGLTTHAIGSFTKKVFMKEKIQEVYLATQREIPSSNTSFGRCLPIKTMRVFFSS